MVTHGRGVVAMRIAFIGKGGAGKSSIVGTFARLLARTDARDVVVLDTDVMPGLAHALGIEATDTPIPDDAVVENDQEGQPRFRLQDGLTAKDAVEAYALPCPDGVRLLQMGKLRGHASDLRRSQFAFRQISRDLAEDHDWHLVGDLAGGTRQPFFGWGAYASTMIVVVEPTAKSFLTARRMTRLANLASQPTVVAVANKVTDPSDRDHVEQATGLRVIGAIPWDPMIGDADRAGKAVLDLAPDTPAVESIRSLVDRLREELT
jgi:CO dehydrogenase maturation factor